MPSLCLLESPHAWHVVVFLTSILEALLNLRVKLGLIAFDRQHVVGALITDCLRGLLLAMHGIQRHDRACQFQQLQEFRYRRDLVGILIDCHLA